MGLFAAAPKYIFYFIGDGMGPGQVMTAETYNRLVLNAPDKLTMSSFPVNSFSTTYSASSPVTDSAAAGTALATGHKTKNGMLGMDADTVAVNSIAKVFHDNGYGVGIITNVAADDATPGAFYAHVPSRNMHYEIGRQAAESGYEVIAGAALRGHQKDGKETDLFDYVKSKGVDIVGSTREMRESDSRRIILLPDSAVWEWDGGYIVDQIPGTPDIADMTAATIDHLAKHTPEKFFIMAEGGNIDHASHANDGGAVIREMLLFNRAIENAVKFAQKHPDETLIVITADHETGGMSVGNNTTGYNACLQYLTPQKISKEIFSNYCDKIIKEQQPVEWPEMKQFLTEKLGFYTEVPINDKQDQRLRQAFEKAFKGGDQERQHTLYADINSFPVEVFKMLNDIAGIGWTTLAHTGNFVPVFAKGAGAELFMGQNDNTQIPGKILKAAGLSK